ncbi:antioxidant, AhpC/Tsa family protein [Shewanella benthica KT99]|uniref:Antioxidant, AhpC/Tsa family protein n=1 Tax=Shewanella benthica KT99 TaxID=314608 RepID=A9CY75_9GAMM|nr:antioxidant, AhpC/Tsa family protein [Shewanella benthica KT99]
MLGELTGEGMVTHNVAELFSGKKVVLFAVLGAFTPTCFESHLPGSLVIDRNMLGD